jgi:hypothetical protein
MLTENNLVLTRAEPSGHGGVQFIYRIATYGIAAISRPKEELRDINWEVDIIKFKDDNTLIFELCHSTELANRTLIFHNDKSVNEFLEKAFAYFKELNTLEKMLPG